MVRFVFYRLENIMEKGENAGYHRPWERKKPFENIVEQEDHDGPISPT